MNKVIAVAAVLALTSAESRFYPKQRPIPNLVAYDNEMVYYKNPKDYPNRPYGFFTDSVRDDELFLDTATDNEMVWYPNGYGPKPIRTSDGSYMVTRSVQHQDDELMMRIDPSEPRPHRRIFSPLVNSAQDDELFVEDANDDELVYYFNPKDYPKTSNPFVMTHALHDDELFVETANDNEMVWYPPSEAYKYQRNPFGPITQVHDDEQMIRLDPREWKGFTTPKTEEYIRPDPRERKGFNTKTYDDDEQMIRLDPREWQGFNTKTYDDDELFNAEQVEGKVQKFKDTLSKHTETIKQAQKDVKNLGGILKKLAQDQKNGVQNDNFPLLGQLIKEGRHLAHEVKAQRTQKKPEVHDNNLFIEDVQDNDLSLKDKIKGAVNWVGDHPQVISEGAKAYKTLRGGK